MATGEKGKKSIKHVPLPIPKKKLPDAVRTIPAACDHAIVEFRGRDEAYQGEGQLVDFKVVNNRDRLLDSQVQVHLRLVGSDKKSKPQRNELLTWILTCRQS